MLERQYAFDCEEREVCHICEPKMSYSSWIENIKNLKNKWYLAIHNYFNPINDDELYQ